MTDDQITELLFVREEPVRADLAMVFGAANEADLARRTRQGVRLYREGYVPRLLVTGGGVLALTRPEAARTADLARRVVRTSRNAPSRRLRKSNEAMIRGSVAQGLAPRSSACMASWTPSRSKTLKLRPNLASISSRHCSAMPDGRRSGSGPGGGGRSARGGLRRRGS